jgi:hypothetical protein
VIVVARIAIAVASFTGGQPPDVSAVRRVTDDKPVIPKDPNISLRLEIGASGNAGTESSSVKARAGALARRATSPVPRHRTRQGRD